MQNISWSTFRSAEDAEPKPHTGKWSELSDLLSKRHNPETGRLQGMKKGMPAFSGTIFRENTRRACDTAETLHLIAFDFDNAVEETTGEFFDEARTRPKMRKIPSPIIADPEEICALLTEKNVTHRAYTTWSSRPEWVKFRLVVPLKMPLTPSIYAAATEVAIRDLGLEKWRASIDIKVIRDTARLHFLPGAEPDQEVKFWRHDGEWFLIDTSTLEQITVPPLPRNEYARPKISGDVDWNSFGIDLNTLELGKLLEALGCNLGRERKLDDGGTKRRSTCPWGQEHAHGADGDDAVVMESPGKWPSWTCAHSGHSHMGLRDVLELALAQKLDLKTYAKALGDDIQGLIDALGMPPDFRDVLKVLKLLARIPKIQQEIQLAVLKKKSGVSISTLRTELAAVISTHKRAEASDTDITEDNGHRVAEEMLDKIYAGGSHLIQTLDGSWWSYTGTHWQRVQNKNTIRGHLLTTLSGMELKEKESAVLDSAYALLGAMQAKDYDVLHLKSVQPRVVNCRNGELWIAEDGTVDLKPHRADSYLSYVLNVDYDPQAECPVFEKALLDTYSLASDPEDMVRHFGEFLGYAIQPRREYKTWWLFQGSGDNGKTRVLQTLQRLMNSSCIYPTRIGNADKSDHTRAALAGKLLLLDDDVDTGTLLPDGFLKQVSEDKLLSGRNLYADQFEFVCTALPVLLCNNWPQSKDLSPATQKRAQVVPFDRVFDVKKEWNPYPHIWKEEMNGVLNFALAGYKRLQARGFFEEPEACGKAKRKFLSAANPVFDFLSMCDRVTVFTCPTMELYKSYQIWANEEGHRFQVKKSEFERDLTNLGFEVYTDPHLKQRCVVGVKPMDFAGRF